MTYRFELGTIEAVELTRDLLEIADRVLERRLKNYDSLGLATDQRSGKHSRSDRQLVGILGEIAVKVAYGMTPKEPWLESGLDGGSDIVIPWGKNAGKTVQVMTSSTGICRFCYCPEFKPLKANFVVQCARYQDTIIEILAHLSFKEYHNLRHTIIVGGFPYKGVEVSQMHRHLP